MEKTHKCKPPCKTLVLAETTLKILYLPLGYNFIIHINYVLAMRMISVKNIYLSIYNSQWIKCELYHTEKHFRKKIKTVQ